MEVLVSLLEEFKVWRQHVFWCVCGRVVLIRTEQAPRWIQWFCIAGHIAVFV